MLEDTRMPIGYRKMDPKIGRFNDATDYQPFLENSSVENVGFRGVKTGMLHESLKWAGDNTLKSWVPG